MTENDKLREEVINKLSDKGFDNAENIADIMRIVDSAIKKARKDEWNKVTDSISYKRMKEKDKEIADLKAEKSQIRNNLLDEIEKKIVEFEKVKKGITNKQITKHYDCFILHLKELRRTAKKECSDV